jgi:hypothetical protein
MTHITIILDKKPEDEKKVDKKAPASAEAIAADKPKAKRARKTKDSE